MTNDARSRRLEGSLPSSLYLCSCLSTYVSYATRLPSLTITPTFSTDPGPPTGFACIGHQVRPSFAVCSPPLYGPPVPSHFSSAVRW